MIKFLPLETIRAIAAGEIIERPLGCVRELVDNALDSGASVIVIDVSGGGLESITVIDDGEGMSPEDALLAPERHATSKIYNPQDIDEVRTLGFRGEALFAMAMAGELTIETRAAREAGIRVRAHDGVIQGEPCGCRVGTRVRVEKLFNNLPARKAVQQAAAEELRQISRLVKRVALAHHGVHVKLVSKKTLYDWPRAASTRERVRQVLGVEGAEIDYSEGGIRISGVVSARTTRRRSALTVHGRLVGNLSLFNVLDGVGLEGWLNIEAEGVQVNVSPTKMFVQFVREDLVLDALRHALGRHVEQRKMVEAGPVGLRGVEGSIANTFLMIPGDGGVLYVDQHSASERLLYEVLRREPVECVAIEPIWVPLDREQVALLEVAQDELAEMGLSLSLGDGGAWVDSAPEIARRQPSASDLALAIRELTQGAPGAGLLVERMMRRMACSAAVKSGEALTGEARATLWQEVREMDMTELDIHGRSGAVWIGLDELWRRVGRGTRV